MRARRGSSPYGYWNGRVWRGREASFMWRSETRAERLVRALRGLAPQLEVLMLPPWDGVPYDRAGPSRQTMGRRIAALRRLTEVIEMQQRLRTPAKNLDRECSRGSPARAARAHPGRAACPHSRGRSAGGSRYLELPARGIGAYEDLGICTSVVRSGNLTADRYMAVSTDVPYCPC